MKYAHVLATQRISATVSARGRVVVRARLRGADQHRADPVPDGPGDQRDPRPSSPHAVAARGRDPAGGPRPAGIQRAAPAGCRARLAGRRGGHARDPLRPAAAARARLLRPSADRPADVARDRRPAVGPVLPRLRADLHRPIGGHDPAGRGRDVHPAAKPGGDLARTRAVRGADRLSLWAPLKTRHAGGPAADRRADRRHRGERLRGARRQGVRAGASPARPVRQHGPARVRPAVGRDPDPGLLQPDDQLPAEPRPGRDPAVRRSRR